MYNMSAEETFYRYYDEYSLKIDGRKKKNYLCANSDKISLNLSYSKRKPRNGKKVHIIQLLNKFVNTDSTIFVIPLNPESKNYWDYSVLKIEHGAIHICISQNKNKFKYMPSHKIFIDLDMVFESLNLFPKNFIYVSVDGVKQKGGVENDYTCEYNTVCFSDKSTPKTGQNISISQKLLSPSNEIII